MNPGNLRFSSSFVFYNGFKDLFSVADHAGITLGRISTMQTRRSSEDVAENGAREITGKPSFDLEVGIAIVDL